MLRRDTMVEKVVPILASGGTRLPAHLGVLHALNKLQIKFDNIVGVSSGSIITNLFAFGLSIEDIKEIVSITDYTQFTGFSFFKLIPNTTIRYRLPNRIKNCSD
jgi:NTE family protein